MAGSMDIPIKTRRLSFITSGVDRPASWLSHRPFFSRHPSSYKNARHVAIVLKEVSTGFEGDDSSDSDVYDSDSDDEDPQTQHGKSIKEVDMVEIDGDEVQSEDEEEDGDGDGDGDEPKAKDGNEDQAKGEGEDEDEDEDFLSLALSMDEPVDVEEFPTIPLSHYEPAEGFRALDYLRHESVDMEEIPTFPLPNDEPFEDFLTAVLVEEKSATEEEEKQGPPTVLEEKVEVADVAEEVDDEEEYDFLADILSEDGEFVEVPIVSNDSGTVERVEPKDVPPAVQGPVRQSQPTVPQLLPDSHRPVVAPKKPKGPPPSAPSIAKKKKKPANKAPAPHPVIPAHPAPVSSTQPIEAKKRKRGDEHAPPQKKRKTKVEQRLAREQSAIVARNAVERMNTNSTAMAAVPGLRRHGWMSPSGTSSGASTPIGHSRGSTPIASSSKATTPLSAVSGLSQLASGSSTSMPGPSSRMSKPAELAQAQKPRYTKNQSPLSRAPPSSMNRSVSEASRPIIAAPGPTIPVARAVSSASVPSSSNSSVPLPFRSSSAAKPTISSSSTTLQPRPPPNRPSYPSNRPPPHAPNGPPRRPPPPPRASVPAPSQSMPGLPSKPSKEVIDLSGRTPVWRPAAFHLTTTTSNPYTQPQRPSPKRKWDRDPEPGSFKRRG